MSRGGMNDGFIWERLVPVNNVNDGYDFAYDFTGQTVYWLEHNHSTVHDFDHAVNIKRVKFDGEQRDILMTTSMNETNVMSEPYCLEFDATARNLILGSVSDATLSVLNVDNLQSSVIFAGSNSETGVGRPTMLTVNFLDSEVYWIDEVSFILLNSFTERPRIWYLLLPGTNSQKVLKIKKFLGICTGPKTLFLSLKYLALPSKFKVVSCA